MIYIDPPYNTGNDFIYRDDYSQPRRAYLEKTSQVDAEGNVLTSNPETSGRYHSDWLTMMYPRLFLARQLLREDGVIFVSIDDNEVHHLRLLMGEVKLFVKLPDWFTVSTPIGDYNPDWAIVFYVQDAFGEVREKLYLVRETKGTVDEESLRGVENLKIACARRHFEAIEVDYDVIVSGEGLRHQVLGQ